MGGLTLAWLVGSGLLSMLSNSEVNWEAMQEGDDVSVDLTSGKSGGM